MRFLHTMVRVRDLEESLDFFCRKLGFRIVRRTDHEAGRFSLVFLAASGDGTAETAPLIELTYNWPPKGGGAEKLDPPGRAFGHIALEVEDIYELCQKLQDEGVTILRPPRDGHMAFVKSPDGISIELLQKGASLEPAEPWQSMANTGSW